MNTFFALVIGFLVGYLVGVFTSKFLKVVLGLLALVVILGYLYVRYIAS